MTDKITGEYHGSRRPLFGLALRTTLLTVLTLGLYRFWAKTRIRKYIWSSIAGDGDSFEYTGTGLEKLLGFLLALVVLALCLGVVQMVLFYFGLSLLDAARESTMLYFQFGAVAVAFLSIVPLIFFAQYRARRYRLARSRWRGVRFGAEPGAWGYVLRAMGHWALSLVSLGLLLPRQTFYLEKFKTDRTWYGDARFRQGGTWWALYPAMKHSLIGVALMIVALGLFGAGQVVNAAAFALLGFVWAAVGLVSYRVRSFVYLTAHKTLDGGIRFRATPETRTIVKKIVVGGLVLGLLGGVMLGALGLVLMGLMEDGALPVGATLLPMVAAYMLALAVIGALTLVWITQPIIAHVVATLKIENAGGLARIRQRAGDSGTDAEGFADALDIGGGI
ncbi:YjgN family protein [Roseovarius pelagicus]|uniref:YjgN family protein n=1 Tax=Roseovarius pelagicus TaxID=2980108 RepID=A0ABY6DEH0_9RHOB|nr:YjgN family protein [Roseovarius pelagicus]UXX84454.1 YjgN family protein [Roseovarius pelagicus]